MVKFTFQDGSFYEGDTADAIFDGWYFEGWTGAKSGLTQEEFVMNWAKTVPGITEDMPSIDFLRAIVAKFPNSFTLEEGNTIAGLAERTGSDVPRTL